MNLENYPSTDIISVCSSSSTLNTFPEKQDSLIEIKKEFQSLLDQAYSVLECAICLNIYSIPITIPCGHSYCYRCILKCFSPPNRVESGKTYFNIEKCPLCRTPIRLDLTPSLGLRQMVEAIIPKLDEKLEKEFRTRIELDAIHLKIHSQCIRLGAHCGNQTCLRPKVTSNVDTNSSPPATGNDIGDRPREEVAPESTTPTEDTSLNNNPTTTEQDNESPSVPEINMPSNPSVDLPETENANSSNMLSEQEIQNSDQLNSSPPRNSTFDLDFNSNDHPNIDEHDQTEFTRQDSSQTSTSDTVLPELDDLETLSNRFSQLSIVSNNVLNEFESIRERYGLNSTIPTPESNINISESLYQTIQKHNSRVLDFNQFVQNLQQTRDRYQLPMLNLLPLVPSHPNEFIQNSNNSSLQSSSEVTGVNGNEINNNDDRNIPQLDSHSVSPIRRRNALVRHASNNQASSTL
ncbi:hypothetical protein BC833DRAFT_595470 [Globomyces pollinis-pini]|nr:hypothetical protein BC833DRAFT_595470 [Globomyces pollinis-pini]